MLRYYREWADAVFPKLAFRDVIKRIERLSKTSKSMRIYIRALKDAIAEGRTFDESEFMTIAALQEANEAVTQMDAEKAQFSSEEE